VLPPRGRCGATRDCAETRGKVILVGRLLSTVVILSLARGIPRNVLRNNAAACIGQRILLRKILAPCHICTQPQCWLAGVWSCALGRSTMSVRDMQKIHRIALEALVRRTRAHSSSESWTFLHLGFALQHLGHVHLTLTDIEDRDFLLPIWLTCAQTQIWKWL